MDSMYIIYISSMCTQDDHVNLVLCVAVCCSVLQCVAVCCGLLQCLAVCCSVLPYFTVCYIKNKPNIHSNKSYICRLKQERREAKTGDGGGYPRSR